MECQSIILLSFVSLTKSAVIREKSCRLLDLNALSRHVKDRAWRFNSAKYPSVRSLSIDF